jgi:hypothetical protein
MDHDQPTKIDLFILVDAFKTHAPRCKGETCSQHNSNRRMELKLEGEDQVNIDGPFTSSTAQVENLEYELNRITITRMKSLELLQWQKFFFIKITCPSIHTQSKSRLRRRLFG